MQEFPANSQKARTRTEATEPRKIERVTSVEAQQRKRGLGRQFKETFIGGSAKMAVEYMVLEVVIPEIQDMMVNAFQGGVEKLIRGEGARSRRGMTSSYANVGRVNYQGMSSNSVTKPPATQFLSQQSRTRHDFRELVIENRTEAHDVLDQMFELLSRDGVVYVHDLYSLTGIQATHTDYKWGWTELRGARVVPLRGGNGYLLGLPEPKQLN